jgi:arylsulfatase A-like enzyme
VQRVRPFVRDIGLVLGAYVVLLAIENLVVGLGWRSEFVGTWEMGTARAYVSPIALALLVPVAALAVLVGRLAGVTPRVVAALGGASGAVVAIGVSSGRRLSGLALRVPFVLVVAAVSAVAALWLARRLVRRSPAVLAAGGAAVAAAAWLADAFVLPRLYPALHLALLAIALGGWALTASALRGRRAPLVSGAGLAIAAASIAWTPHAARASRTADNLRRVLVEHAPLLGRAVIVAARIAPPPPLEDDDGSATATLTSLRSRSAARALDWHGRDLVLVTIDALRADHVSAYGYPRRTTPNIDALAARGVRFERAYCPTPHTSYSVTSMMTGKYMKPLLALAPADASETWPVQLRRYGYRTAAFYPPAVFFIDEHRFTRMRDENLGFEYYKEEYARPELRRAQIERYLSLAPPGTPLFLWVHLFEPHEPYEMHPEHRFTGDPRVDAYDSEVAAADALVGEIVKMVSERRPAGAVFIVSADHGEEHGDHGGRYHGTTVYEEQVRVPLVVVAPGLAPRVVAQPVQTIDLLPTSLAALDVPIPPRLRGRDLGPLLVGAGAADEGLAFAETDDYTLVARGSDRLVCARKIGSCTLFDVARDPGQRSPVADRPERVAELRKLTAAIERETGKLEVSDLPDALRRGLQGDRDAAEDVAPLLDDARVSIRRLAARCAFRLRAPDMAPQLRRAMEKDDDAEVRRWSALALARLGEPAPLVESLLDPTAATDERTAAALALAEHGDGRGEAALVARWSAAFAPAAGEGTSPRAEGAGELDEARDLLAALAKLRARAAVPALVRSLDDVRLRPHVVTALAAIGDPRAKEPLLRVFASERYVHLRPLEARALAALGAQGELLPPLMRFAGTPEPMAEAIVIARDAGLLVPDRGGHVFPPPGPPPRSLHAATRVRLATPGPARVLVLAEGGGPLRGRINGMEFPDTLPLSGSVYVIEAGELPGEVELSLGGSDVRAAWVVPRAPEIPPPPPRAWTATPGAESDGGL